MTYVKLQCSVLRKVQEHLYDVSNGIVFLRHDQLSLQVNYLTTCMVESTMKTTTIGLLKPLYYVVFMYLVIR